MAANGSGCRRAARGCQGSVLTSAALQPPEQRSQSIFKTQVKTQACSRDRGGTTVPRRAGQAFLGAAVSGPATSRRNGGSSEHSPGHKRVTSRLLFPYSCSPLPWELCPTSCSSQTLRRRAQQRPDAASTLILRSTKGSQQNYAAGSSTLRSFREKPR